jgi:hypothetical protein
MLKRARRRSDELDVIQVHPRPDRRSAALDAAGWALS